MKFAPIHNHTEYSPLDGLATCREVAERCKEIGCGCVGITDHMTVAGHLEFAKVMAKHDLKPIFGCELYHGVKTEFGKQERDQSHFVAGAISDEGLRNLWRLVDASSTNYRFVSRVNWDMLQQYSAGVFATTACISGTVAKGVLETADWDPYDMLNRYLEIFRNNFYVEIHTYPGDDHERLNRELVAIANERGIPLIYATDAHFASPEQYEVHDAYVAMKSGDSIYTPIEDRKMWHPKSLYIQSEEEIRASLSYLSDSTVDEALRNSAELAEMCNASLPEVRPHMPQFVVSECPWLNKNDFDVSVTLRNQETAGGLLIGLTKRGIEKRYGPNIIEDEIWDRAERELEAFLEAGLEHYFLQVWDFCQFCDKEGIQRGPGRGSAAGSIVAYALGITDVDPLHYGLIFERFWNPGRAKGFPDIDTDFPKRHRKRVRQYLVDRWGKDRVRTIGTTTRLKPKAALDKTYKSCGITWDEKEALKKIVSNTPDIEILGADSIGWSETNDPGKTIYVMHPTEQAYHDTGDRIIDWILDQPRNRQEPILRWLDIVSVACSRVSGYGVHPSGVIVSDCDLADEMPCLWNRDQEIPVTCFAMSDVDSRMFLKDDLLGLRNLDTIEEWEKQLGEREWSGLDKQEHPVEIWEQLDHGFSRGIFQIEEGYARRLCKEFKPRSVEDLGIIVALNRPGPIRSGAPDSFITRRSGGTDDKFDGRKIELIADILEPTYGWFLYQEQVIAFFERIGYDKSEADAVRKILGKKKPEEMMALGEGGGEWTDKGYFHMAVQAGLDLPLAHVIWGILSEFAKYSFNKSHAIAYAILGFRTLYAMYYGKAEFTISCIRTNAEEAGSYVSQGRRMGVRVNPPDILNSQDDIAAIDDTIYFGFSNIKGIGKGAARYVIDLRKKGWSEDEFSDEGIELDYGYSIAMGGPQTLKEGLGCRQSLWEEERDAAKALGVAFKKKSPSQQLQVNKIDLLHQAGSWDNYLDRGLPLSKIQKLEKELLGVIITDDCDEVFAANEDYLDSCDSYRDLNCVDDVTLRLPGVVATLKPRETKKDKKPMGLVTIEFQGEQVEFVVFSKPWRDYRFLWKERTPGIFTLTKNDRGVRFEKAVKLT